MLMTEQGKELIRKVEKIFGFVPNMFRMLAECCPIAGRVLVSGGEILKEGSFTRRERQAVKLVISVMNGSEYCCSLSSTAGEKAGLHENEVKTILSGNIPGDNRLNGLVTAAKMIQRQRGRLTPNDLKMLQEKGVSRGDIFEIIAIISLTTLSNFINHANLTDLDEQYQPVEKKYQISTHCREQSAERVIQ